MKTHIDTLAAKSAAISESQLIDYLDQHRHKLTTKAAREIMAAEEEIKKFFLDDLDAWESACDKLYALILKHFNLN